MKLMSAVQFLFIFVGVVSLGNSGYATEICSPAGREALKGLSVDLAKLESYCKKSESNKTTSASSYDLANEKNDFAEVTEDLVNGKAIGKKITLRLSAHMGRHYCIQGGVTDLGKQALYCTTSHGNGVVYLYSSSKETRIDLQRQREKSDTAVVEGVITERYVNAPVIELSK